MDGAPLHPPSDRAPRVPSAPWLDRDGIGRLGPALLSAIAAVDLPPPASDVIRPPSPVQAWQPADAEGRAALAGAAGTALSRRPSRQDSGIQAALPPPPPPPVHLRQGSIRSRRDSDDEPSSSDDDDSELAAKAQPAAFQPAPPSPADPMSANEAWASVEASAASIANFGTDSDQVVFTLIHSPFPGRPATVWFRPADFDGSGKERRPRAPPSLRDLVGQPAPGYYGARGCATITVPRARKSRMMYAHMGEGAVRFGSILATIQGAGLRLSSNVTGNWNLLWAKRLQQEDWCRIGRHQRANHFPGTWGIGRKDALSRNVAAMVKKHGAEHFGFHPRTYILPGDAWLLKAEFDDRSGTRRQGKRGPIFILKPLAAACGKGIRLISKMVPPHRMRPCITQRYIADPMLINSCKFDLRIYAVLTCVNPLRIYIYREGMTRFATEPYPGGSKIRNRFAHLTNYSINKKSEKFSVAQVEEGGEEDGEAAQADGDAGSKWTLTAFRQWCAANGKDFTKYWNQICDVTVKTFLCIERAVHTQMQYMCPRNRNACFELFGFDFLIDSSQRVHLVEVNIMPSLNTQSPLDAKIKGNFVADVLTLIGVTPFDRNAWKQQSPAPRAAGATRKAAPTQPSGEAGAFLAGLHPDELTAVIESEEEHARRGHFQRIFPTGHSYPYYAPFFEQERPLNRLLYEWERIKARVWETGAGHESTSASEPVPTTAPAAPPPRPAAEPSPSPTPAEVPKRASTCTHRRVVGSLRSK
eukprot:Hpha_TRINITY_DN13601_c0_g1::TRINITY_DN13601_c0_g1_i1::g.122805::m.122805/K16601/TTLL4; tubulin polyglutamylase TTLL4